MNQTTYRAAQIVRHYAQLRALQPAEQTIFDLLKVQLPTLKMLDIGVGGGRTTRHFAPAVAEYVGIDYSAEMVAMCDRQFAAHPTWQFAVCDAREMSRFADNTFDFILFSFNGIDYCSHADRLKVLQEVDRIGKPGGYFCFSSHNLQRFEQEFDLTQQLRLNPIVSYTNLVMWGIVRLFNRAIDLKTLKASAHAIVKDDSHNFRLETYYIRPQAQIQQLEPHFDQIQAFSWQSGLEITTESELSTTVEQWLYYFCRIR
jgi:ubiquinone/menaquinone biosynthesis C-methylase UbiE